MCGFYILTVGLENLVPFIIYAYLRARRMRKSFLWRRVFCKLKDMKIFRVRYLLFGSQTYFRKNSPFIWKTVTNYFKQKNLLIKPPATWRSTFSWIYGRILWIARQLQSFYMCWYEAGRCRCQTKRLCRSVSLY